MLGEQTILEAVGMRVMRWINDNFEAEGLEAKWKPLARSTIEQRGPGKILQRTGALRQSFGYHVNGNEVWIGSRHKIAQWHHEGTAPYTIKVKDARVLAAKLVTGKMRFFGKQVNHPGLVSRPLIPTKVVATRIISEMLNAMADAAAAADSKGA
jgi:phage gpG-like protein